MASDWFRFRQFMVRQDRTAMKVGTDGVLLGAWCRCGDADSILDVGTGTGLIALMAAQRNRRAGITAVEVDPSSSEQARANFASSPWGERIRLVEADFITWEPLPFPMYDLITCNPPFFSRSLRNPDESRANARHDERLPLGQLIAKAARMLAASGRLAMILPAGRLREALAAAGTSGLFPSRMLEIRGHSGAPVKRVLIELTYTDSEPETEVLVLEETRGVRSPGYLRLTEEFYL